MGNSSFVSKASSTKTEPGYTSKAIGNENFTIRISDSLLGKLRSQNQNRNGDQNRSQNQQNDQQTRQENINQSQINNGKRISTRNNMKKINARTNVDPEVVGSDNCNSLEEAVSSCFLESPEGGCQVLIEKYRECLENSV